MKNSSINLEQIKSSKFGEYFTHLQDVIERQEKELFLNKKIVQILNHDSRKEIQKLLNDLLGYFKDYEFSSLRIIVSINDNTYGDISVSEGIGPNNEIYSYLDEQVANQIGPTGIIYISDTTKIHSIKFTPGSQFPLTILGFSLGVGQNKIGHIWLAFETQKNFTKFESESLIALVNACTSVIRNSIIWNKDKASILLVNDVINLMDFPLFIVTRTTILFINKTAKTLFDKNLETNAEQNKFIKRIWDLKNKENSPLTNNGQSYQIKFANSGSNLPDALRIVALIDDTLNEKIKSYISLVINSISQSLKSPLNLVLGSIKMLPLVGEVNDHQKTYLMTIKQKIENSLVILEELLDLERIIQNNGLRIQKIESKTLFDLSISLIQHLATQKRILIKNIKSNDNDILTIDKVLFTQALANIFEYAVIQTEIGKEISYNFSYQKDSCVIEINDTGNGLSQVEVEKLNSMDNLSDIPITLLIAHRIISFHAGTLVIESQPGHGNQYSIRIPVTT